MAPSETDMARAADDVDIPGDDPAPAPSADRRPFMSPAMRFGLLVVGVFAVIVLVVVRWGGESAIPESRVPGGPGIDSTPGGSVQAESPRFQQLLEQLNDEAAKQAMDEGTTFISTPEVVLEDIAPEEKKDAPEVPGVLAKTDAAAERPIERQLSAIVPPPDVPGVSGSAQVRPATPRTREEVNPWTAAMISQIGSFPRGPAVDSLTIGSTGWSPPEPEASRESVPSVEPVTLVSSEPGADDTDVAPGTASQVIVPAGSVLYAETLVSVNSDLPESPVLAVVTTGDLRGSRLVGSFSVADGSRGMLVEFRSMTLADGTSIPVSAYAVDGITAEAAVASDVDGRFLQRYGAVLATSFLAGAAQALAEPTTGLQVTDEGVMLLTRERSTERQALYAGMGRAADMVVSDIQARTPKGPLVTLRSGWPLGVLFLESASKEDLR
ncbi:MAG: hypothetical protein F4213_08505 [Boseongicola sp. SB0677_bin_26]|nr:hypothetical protein [Boseongicola sp. SB0665_bin_10]MYG26052.1 hypothetical protein [Boseongicola sp. SB0677_bin_26]